ncbi:hypothetical protein S58_16570 [Bradyrhizobium oligotrophicum S58]|uniref:Uncharacterized protein n=1 Tax=Bradyrhizobium oligotrophicum S58 TaxID=1245469 RepID=M4ZN77_9BRAD|nr:hypothetical protein [Bradyrhizobium oligotrophicum]BAM87665.1 hypothetical protein S58_16570 [Bradyrhizobium oligotrophicum S58]
MPEFVLNVNDYRAFQKLDAFTRGYIEALFFTDEEQLCDESDRDMPSVAIDTATMEPRFVGGDSPGFDDLAPETLAAIIADCEAFQRVHADLLDAAYEHGGERGSYDSERAGNDFWYSRNGHGVGFWDRGLGDIGDALSNACGWKSRASAHPFPERDSYIGDDGKVYLA